MRRWFLVPALLALWLTAAFGQIPFSGGGGPDQNGIYQGMVTISRLSNVPATVSGAPYSGQYSTEFLQTLADGAHISRSNLGDKVWRDSSGRTRVEHLMVPPANGDGPTLIQITDPVGGYQYVMDSVNHVAHRMTLTPQATPQSTSHWATTSIHGGIPATNAAVPKATTAPRAQSTTETLGPRMFGSVMAQGTRYTTVYPAGTQDNDAPITAYSEQWMAPDLKITVLSVSSDPRNGVNTSKIINLERDEPSASLFMVPSDYSVVDETGEFFHITWGAH
jgi:hypothetical protein